VEEEEVALKVIRFGSPGIGFEERWSSSGIDCGINGFSLDGKRSVVTVKHLHWLPERYSLAPNRAL
jgi:hypothetical protein